MLSSHLILFHPLLVPSSIFPSIRVFSNDLALRITWPKYWSFNFNISPSNEHQGVISFRMDWLDLLAGQGTCKSLLQHYSSKPSILWHSAFLIVQFSCPLSWWGHPTTSNHLIICRPLLLPSSFFPKNTQDWSPLEWTGWISLQSKGLSTVFSNTTVQKHQFFSTQPSSQSNSHIYIANLGNIFETKQF